MKGFGNPLLLLLFPSFTSCFRITFSLSGSPSPPVPLFTSLLTTKPSTALSVRPDKVILFSWLLEVSGLCSDEWDILYLASITNPPSSNAAGKLKARREGRAEEVLGLLLLFMFIICHSLIETLRRGFHFSKSQHGSWTKNDLDGLSGDYWALKLWYDLHDRQIA